MNDPTTQSPHSRMVALVTGANSGIGRATAEGLSELGTRVIMLCRSHERGEKAQAEIIEASDNDSVDLLLCDLAVLGEVHRAAGEVLERYDRLDVLVNNAGVYRHRYAETEEGLEKTWAVNYFAPFLLTNLLLERMKATPETHGEARIVNVSSNSHRRSDIQLNKAEQGGPSANEYSGLRVYAATKQAIVLFTRELARRFDGIGVTANAVDPGMVNTAIWSGKSGLLARIAGLFSFLYASSKTAAAGPIRLATDPALTGTSGRYFEKTGEAKPSEAAVDKDAARYLWEISTEIVRLEAN